MKRRCDSWSSSLSEEQQWSSYERSKGLTWFDFAQYIQDEYGISPPKKTAVYEWIAYMRTQEGEYRLSRAIAARQEIQGLSDAGELDARTADAYMALANDAILSGDPDRATSIVDAAVKICSASLRIKEQKNSATRIELQKKTLELNREKFLAAEKRLNSVENLAKDETLSDADRTQKIKEIFGL